MMGTTWSALRVLLLAIFASFAFSASTRDDAICANGSTGIDCDARVCPGPLCVDADADAEAEVPPTLLRPSSRAAATIRAMQEPEDCARAKFLIAPARQGVGFTAVTRSLVQCFAAALALGRTFVVEGHLGDYSGRPVGAREQERVCPDDDYRCLLAPVTSCPPSSWEGPSGSGRIDARPGELVEGDAYDPAIDGPKRVLRARSGYPWFGFCREFHGNSWGALVPSTARVPPPRRPAAGPAAAGRSRRAGFEESGEGGRGGGGNETYSDHGWFGALQLWLLRPSKFVAHEVALVRRSTGLAGALAAGAVVGVHVRRGDRARETKFAATLAEYLDAAPVARAIRAASQRLQRPAGCEVTVLLATDDPAAWDEAIGAAVAEAANPDPPGSGGPASLAAAPVGARAVDPAADLALRALGHRAARHCGYGVPHADGPGVASDAGASDAAVGPARRGGAAARVRVVGQRSAVRAAATSMAGRLASGSDTDAALRLRAGVEVLADLRMLAEADALVGTCSSGVSCVAAGMQIARRSQAGIDAGGAPVALDGERCKRLSWGAQSGHGDWEPASRARRAAASGQDKERRDAEP
jgi:hypothetical protein